LNEIESSSLQVSPADAPGPDLQQRLLENERLAAAWARYQSQLQTSQEAWRLGLGWA
jgi:hypothetical protein